jgi:hypothetical protein
MGLNVGLDASFINKLDWKETQEKAGKFNSMKSYITKEDTSY